jgi:hypothetical protein
LVCATHWYATGRGSDVSTDWKVADAYEVKDGKVVRVIWGYPDVATALEALGLAGAGVRVSLDAPSARFPSRRQANTPPR